MKSTKTEHCFEFVLFVCIADRIYKDYIKSIVWIVILLFAMVTWPALFKRGEI